LISLVGMKTQGRQFIDYATRIYRVVIRMAAVRAPGDGAVGPAAAGKGLMRRMAAAGSGKEECGSVGLMCEWGAGAQNFGFCGGRARRAGGGSGARAARLDNQ